MMASRAAKLRMMKVSVRVPSISGEALNAGAAMMVKSGTCFFSVVDVRGSC